MLDRMAFDNIKVCTSTKTCPVSNNRFPTQADGSGRELSSLCSRRLARALCGLHGCCP